MNWNEYQEEIAKFFRSVGAEATTNERIEGARGLHAIDVVVRFKQFGLQVLWIIECKYWTTSIPKDKVLTLQQIVQDLGADKGLSCQNPAFNQELSDQRRKPILCSVH